MSQCEPHTRELPLACDRGEVSNTSVERTTRIDGLRSVRAILSDKRDRRIFEVMKLGQCRVTDWLVRLPESPDRAAIHHR